MNISIHSSSKQFHLYNDSISYIIGVLPTGDLGHFYFGRKIHDTEAVPMPCNPFPRPMTCNPNNLDSLSPELCSFEYPSFGHGDYRNPAFEVLQENGSRVMQFRYDTYEITEGKPAIEGLPATYANSADEAMTLIVHMVDDLTGVRQKLFYTIFRDYPIIARHVSFINEGKEKVCITKALSMCIDLPDQDYEWIQFQGAWGRERFPVKREVAGGVIAIESMRGISSSNFNPFFILKRPATDEDHGEAMGFHLVYSGNFQAMAEGDSYDKLRVSMGLNDRWFHWPLNKGEAFDTPEAVLSFSDDGIGALSRSIHRFFNNNLVRSVYKNRPRPILLNNWEATGMDFDEETVLKIAGKGKEAGVELFVLDDGWFGARNDDYAGLGDWVVNTNKLPDGINGLAQKIRDMGMEMGLWIEPEMVNEDSDLFREHPDWVLATPGREKSLGRHQMVLDYSRKEVVDAIYDMLYTVISGSGLKYIKWDMNRSMTEVFSETAPPEMQGTIYHKYTLGVYSLYERLIKAFPEILFESCSSGGSRFDAGMLYYAPQAWCSDDTDGNERIKIQYGTSFGYPIVSMGSHVSEVPNQQTGRIVPIDTRAAVAYFGTFGYELDLNELSDEEFEKVKEQIRFMKEYREVIQYGDFYRLQSPFEGDIASWMCTSQDKNCAVAAIYMIHTPVNGGLPRVKLKGLDPDKLYKDGAGNSYYGDYLMSVGIDVYDKKSMFSEEIGDYRSKMVILKV